MQVREQYRFFVVDEFQDVSPLQQQLLRLWIGDRRDLCVVGDASQTIYSFAGASLRLPARFPATLPGCHGGAPRAELPLRRRRSSTRPTGSCAGARALSRCMPATADAAAGRGDAASRSRPIVPRRRAVAQSILELVDAGATRPSRSPCSTASTCRRRCSKTALGDVGVSYQLRGSRALLRPARGQAGRAGAARRHPSRSCGEPLFKSVSDVLRSLGWSQDAARGPRAVRDRWESLNAIMGLVDAALSPTRPSAISPTSCSSDRPASTSRPSRPSRWRRCTRRRDSSGSTSSSSGSAKAWSRSASRASFDADRRGTPPALRRHHARPQHARPQLGVGRAAAALEPRAVAVPGRARHPHSGCGSSCSERVQPPSGLSVTTRPALSPAPADRRRETSATARVAASMPSNGVSLGELRSASWAAMAAHAGSASERARSRQYRHGPRPGSTSGPTRTPSSPKTIGRCGTSRASQGR